MRWMVPVLLLASVVTPALAQDRPPSRDAPRADGPRGGGPHGGDHGAPGGGNRPMPQPQGPAPRPDHGASPQGRMPGSPHPDAGQRPPQQPNNGWTRSERGDPTRGDPHNGQFHTGNPAFRAPGADEGVMIHPGEVRPGWQSGQDPNGGVRVHPGQDGRPRWQGNPGPDGHTGWNSGRPGDPGRPGHGDNRQSADLRAGQGWNRGWRDDHRYDWQGWRNTHRDAYRADRYRPPYGYGAGYRRFGIGNRLDPIFFEQNYWISDPWYYRLPPAYGPYRWVRYYNDALLIDIYTGDVVDEISDIFW